jgi:tripartite-type tricarboxylate transporter receptor subunit TctC
MKLSRKTFLHFAAGAGALPILMWSALSAVALDYPTRPVHIIVGFPAGTSSDITARLIAQRLSEQLGQQFVVENRTGAGTNVAADSVVHASADGYTLLWVTQTKPSMRRCTTRSTSILSTTSSRSPAFFAFPR